MRTLEQSRKELEERRKKFEQEREQFESTYHHPDGLNNSRLGYIDICLYWRKTIVTVSLKILILCQ